MWRIHHLSILWLLLQVTTVTSMLFSDVSSLSGNLNFQASEGTTHMTLNATGLGIHTVPSSNLHVQGNAIISNQMTIGSSTSGTSNLHINGSFAMTGQHISDNLVISEQNSYGLYFVDNSAANITITLPHAGNVIGRKIFVKGKSTAHDIFIYANASEVEDHYALVLKGGQEILPAISVISANTSWRQLSSFGNVISAFTPSTTSPTIWMDANSTSSLTFENTNRVQSWVDLGGNGYVFQRPSSNEAPTWGTNLLNGRPTIDFDGSNDRLAISAAGPQPSSNNQMMLFVAQLNTDHDGRVLSLRNADGTRNGLLPNWSSRSNYVHAGSFSPALQGAIESSYNITCKEHQKNIGLGFQMYTEEYDGSFPRTRTRVNGVWTGRATNIKSQGGWRGLLLEDHFGVSETRINASPSDVSASALFSCPSMLEKIWSYGDIQSNDINGWHSYGDSYSANFAWAGDFKTLRTTDIDRSDFPLILDSGVDNKWTQGTIKYQQPMRITQVIFTSK